MRVTKDLLSGLLFAGLGFGAVIIARGYELGSATRMGPGYFPILLGGLVGFLGLIVCVRALIRPDTSEPVGGWEIRPLTLILAGILAFAALIDSWGLIASLAALILVGRLAGREGGAIELIVILVTLTAVAVGIFVYALNMPLQLGPW